MLAWVLTHFSPAQLFATLWTAAHQAPLSVGLSREEYWSGLPFPHPGNLPDPGIEPASLVSPALQAGCLPLIHLAAQIPAAACGFFTVASRILSCSCGIFSCSLWTPSCRTWDPVPWPGIKPQAPCIGSAESQALDHQGSPGDYIFNKAKVDNQKIALDNKLVS